MPTIPKDIADGALLRITGAAASSEAATRDLKKLLTKTRCTSCASIVNTALSSLQSGASVKSTEAAVRRESLVVDAVRTGARVDVAQSLSDGGPASAGLVRDAVDKGLAVDPAAPGATPQIEQIQHKVERQRERADATIDKATVTPDESAVSPPAAP